MIAPGTADFRAALPEGGRLLGLDVGTRTIGTALCDAGWTIATPAELIRRTKFAKDLAALKALIGAQRVAGIVIGLPLNLDGSESPRTQSLRAFARNVETLGLPILLWDERWSTQAVTRTLIEADASRARRAELVDKMAAAYILQGAIDALTMGGTGLGSSPMPAPFPHRHLLGIEGLSAGDLRTILDEAEPWIAFNRGARKADGRLAGLTQINAFFENSTRTLFSFEIAGKRLGAQVSSFHPAASSVRKGESLIDTALTLNAMGPDILVIRHEADGAAAEVAEVMDCPVINAGDGRGEHPTQALLDALTIRRRLGRIEGLNVAICGDVMHSRVANSNMLALPLLGANVRAVAPAALMPTALPAGVAAFTELDEGIAGADVVMMLRIQRERMEEAFPDTLIDFHTRYGLTRARLDRHAPGAIVMHPGPMNRGVEIDGELADDPARSAILEQVELGVAVRMACLDLLTRERR